MKTTVIEIQYNEKTNIFNFVARDTRTGIIQSCGYDTICLISFIESLTKK